MILLMALLDDFSRPGIFQNKLDQGLRDNELPHISYTPEPETSRIVMTFFTANQAITEELSHRTTQDKQANTLIVTPKASTSTVAPAQSHLRFIADTR